MSTKRDPGQYDCYAKLTDDEPYFVLRAKDLDAPAVVEEWVARRLFAAYNSGQEITPEYNQKLTEALQCAEAMRQWRMRQLALAMAARET